MGRLSTKLDELPSTVVMCLGANPADLAFELLNGKDRPTIAVGSGGSAISAEYFRRCRDTCGFARTAVETPMQFVTDMSGLSGIDVWLFTAGAENADIMAAVQSAHQRGASHVFIVTRNPGGRAAVRLTELGGMVFTVPVSDQKDGFLATHSLIATVTTLLLAFDATTEVPFGEELADRFESAVKIELSKTSREEYRASFSRLTATDTLIVLSEPQLSPVSALIDTSVWEASICNVQSTDFRNFSHGRHTWLHHRRDATFIVALTGLDWQPVHASVLSLIPPDVRKSAFDFGNCGRFENAIGIVRGLALIEAMGHAVDVDPGKPGVGSFGREVYDDEALYTSAKKIESAVRHKYAAALEQDSASPSTPELAEAFLERTAALKDAKIGAIVLDYDGTVVRTEDRFAPPENEIADQFFRLRELGVSVAIATGRGGSVGEDLRQIFDAEAQKDILIGYYNGAYLQPLDVDIDVNRPDPDSDIDEAIGWMEGNNHLFCCFDKPKRGVQISIQKRDLVSADQFELAISEFLPSVGNRLRLDRSAHSYDLVVARASKLNVVQAVQGKVSEDAVVLCIGDSGTVMGNDHDLISSASGISVDTVCCSPEGSWSLFGYEHSGPDALRQILASLIPAGKGCVRLAPDVLKLDKRVEIGT